ncbi:substrate-binding domain-containing protein [Microcella alkaliphila]|nr:substrate-binding domain-containing protein [Microcella alkaliphila]
MRQSRSMTLGLIATDIRNPYFAELTMAVEEAVHDAGYTLFVGYNRDSVDRQREQIEAMIQRQVDGILLLPSIGSTRDSVGRLVWTTKVPIVQFSRYFTDDLDYVGPDNRAAGENLAAHIASLGSGSAVLIGGPTESSARRERLQGLVSGLAGTQVRFDPADSVSTLNIPDDGARGLGEFLDRGTLPDSVICYSDAVAQGVYGELRRRNLEPGSAVSVASFDDAPLAALQYPPLTSVATHAASIGRKASELLLARLQDGDEPPRRVLIEPTLKVRASTALWRPRGIAVAR